MPDPMTARDSLELSLVGRWAALHLEGEFDLANAGRITAAAGYLAEHGVTELTVDLTRVDFLDVTAVDALDTASQVLAGRRGRVLLVAASHLTARVVALVGLAARLPALPRAGQPCRDTAGRHGDAPGLAGLRARLTGGATVTGDLCRIVGAAIEAVPGCTAASCTLTVGGRRCTVAAAAPLAVECDLLQERLGSGPAARAAERSVGARLLPGGEADDRLIHAGRLTDAWSVPIHLGGATVGSLNAYSQDPEGLPGDAEAALEVLATVASTTLASRLAPLPGVATPAPVPPPRCPADVARAADGLGRLLAR